MFKFLLYKIHCYLFVIPVFARVFSQTILYCLNGYCNDVLCDLKVESTCYSL